MWYVSTTIKHITFIMWCNGRNGQPFVFWYTTLSYWHKITQVVHGIFPHSCHLIIMLVCPSVFKPIFTCLFIWRFWDITLQSTRVDNWLELLSQCVSPTLSIVLLNIYHITHRYCLYVILIGEENKWKRVSSSAPHLGHILFGGTVLGHKIYLNL